MKHLLLFLLLSIASHQLVVQGQNLAIKSKLRFEKEKISQGLVWKSVHAKDLFGAPQYISILEIGRYRRLAIDFESSALKPTSQFAEEEQALAAVNAGFFNMKEGGSVTFMKVDDEVIHPNTTESELLTKSCIAVDERGKLHIEKAQPLPYYELPEHYDDVLFTGPLLIANGNSAILSDAAFNKERHPRTCACIKKNGKQLLITVDGRNEQAAGMSLFELTALLQSLQCRQAINLDGGGSTTMWIQGKGVVNHPSDNKQFDHAGERKVANVVLVR